LSKSEALDSVSSSRMTAAIFARHLTSDFTSLAAIPAHDPGKICLHFRGFCVVMTHVAAREKAA